MANRNIQMKKGNGTGWDNLYPVTLSSNVYDSRGDSLSQVVSNLYEIQQEINVRTPPYNLKGDGTDTEASIQALFDLAKSNAEVNLYFPKGVWYIEGYIRLYKNTHVKMHKEAVFRHKGSSYKMFINGELGNKTYTTQYNGEGNISFIGGTIDLNWEGSSVVYNANISAFDLAHAENLLFKDMIIENGQNGHYFQISSCKNVVFDSCIIRNQEHRNTANSNYETIQIEIASEASFPTFGGYDLTPSRDITVMNCTFDNVIRGVGTHGDGLYEQATTQYCENIRIINNNFKNVRSHAMMLTGYRNLTVADNSFEDILGYVFYVYRTSIATFADNVMRRVDQHGAYIRESESTKWYNNHMEEISLNATTKYAGFRLVTSSDNFFDGNIVRASVTGQENYSYAFYASDGSLRNRISSHKFNMGTSGRIYGSTSDEIAQLEFGGGTKVLFEGDLATEGATATFDEDLRIFSQIVVVGNGNSGAASMVTITIPKPLLTFGATTSRYRMIIADSVNVSSQIDFSFPTSKSVKVDTLTSAVGHIRTIIGMV